MTYGNIGTCHVITCRRICTDCTFNYVSREPIDVYPAISATVDPESPENGYVIIQASGQGSYIEVNDQNNSDYGVLDGFVVEENLITLKLNKPLGNMSETAICLKSTSELDEIVEGLNEVLSYE